MAISLLYVLCKVLPENMDLLCTHPMFGPESGKHGWQDLSFMYDRVRIRDEGLCSSFIHIFSSEVGTGVSKKSSIVKYSKQCSNGVYRVAGCWK